MAATATAYRAATSAGGKAINFAIDEAGRNSMASRERGHDAVAAECCKLSLSCAIEQLLRDDSEFVDCSANFNQLKDIQ